MYGLKMRMAAQLGGVSHLLSGWQTRLWRAVAALRVGSSRTRESNYLKMDYQQASI